MEIIIVDQTGLSLLENIENSDRGFPEWWDCVSNSNWCLHLKSSLSTIFQEKDNIFVAYLRPVDPNKNLKPAIESLETDEIFENRFWTHFNRLEETQTDHNPFHIF